ncbi:uracil-DNA glycosylase [Tsukamurella serpentis]
MFDPHIAPFNRMVDELSSDDEWMPYVAPLYGGTQARVLSLFRDPGPATQVGTGSGMLCIENRDESAKLHRSLVQESGIDLSELMTWNAYPWYINRAPKAPEIARALPVLHRVIDLCPDLRVVVLHGGSAHQAWRAYRSRFSIAARRLHVIETYHTSRQAFWHKDEAIRASRMQNLRDGYAEAAEWMHRD